MAQAPDSILLLSQLLLAGLTAGLVSCASSASTSEEFDFEIKRPETNEEKMERVFGSYDPKKRSLEEGKSFHFGGTGNSDFAKSVDRKAYPVHPYFKVRDREILGDFSVPRESAREANMAADQQGRTNRRFQRTFRTGEAEPFKKALPKRENPDFTDSQRPSSNAHEYGKREFWTEIIEDIKEGDSLSVEDVQALFAPY